MRKNATKTEPPWVGRTYQAAVVPHPLFPASLRRLKPRPLRPYRPLPMLLQRMDSRRPALRGGTIAFNEIGWCIVHDYEGVNGDVI